MSGDQCKQMRNCCLVHQGPNVFAVSLQITISQIPIRAGASRVITIYDYEYHMLRNWQILQLNWIRHPYLCWNMYMGKRPAAMLAAKRLAGATLEVNLRECISHIYLHQVRIRLPTLKPRGDVTRSPIQGYQRPHKKHLCPPKILKKKKIAAQFGSTF